jgi:alcohol dehydrogenase class IV
MTGFFTAPQVGWGTGAVEQLSGLAARKAFLIVDPSIARRDGHRRILEEFEKSNTTTEVSTAVEIEPTVASIEPVAMQLRTARPDWIVAVGGGSTIDTAKAAWARYAHPDLDLESISPLVDLAPRSVAKLVAFPTTGGSGSEATWVVDLRQGDGHIAEIGVRELTPDWALLDPTLSASQPPAVTAETAGDLLAHGLEALVSEWSNGVTDALARESVAAALTALPRVMRHPDDVETRERLQVAATMAGIAAANAQTGLAHAIAHAVGGVVRLPHARLASTLLPFVIEFNFPSAREKYGTLGPDVGPAAAQNRSALPEKIRSLWEQAGLPRSLAAAGAPVDRLNAEMDRLVTWTRSAPSFGANPRIPSGEEIRRLLGCAADGRSVDF